MLRFPLRSALVALALLLGASTNPTGASASEQDFPVAGADFQRARAVAQAYWGAVPCQGQVTFTWQGLEPLTNARATWSNPSDAWKNAGANFDCSVVFNGLTQYDFPRLCTVMAHELGHLLGHPHEGQVGLLMSSIYAAPLPECGGTPASGSADQQADDDPIAWSVSKPKAKAKKSAKKPNTSAKRNRCVIRLKAGKRVRRCVPLRRPSSRKARTASFRPQARVYVAH